MLGGAMSSSWEVWVIGLLSLRTCGEQGQTPWPFLGRCWSCTTAIVVEGDLAAASDNIAAIQSHQRSLSPIRQLQW